MKYNFKILFWISILYNVMLNPQTRGSLLEMIAESVIKSSARTLFCGTRKFIR